MDVDEEAALFFRIGSSNRQHVIVRPSRREFPEAGDYWDGNWVYATIEIAAGAFRARIDSALLRAEEFVQFRDQLRPLHESRVGTAALRTMEEWLRIDIEGDGKGHFRAACEARDRPGMGNRLTFEIDFDQTELPSLIQGLDAICEAIPEVGSRS